MEKVPAGDSRIVIAMSESIPSVMMPTSLGGMRFLGRSETIFSDDIQITFHNHPKTDIVKNRGPTITNHRRFDQVNYSHSLDLI